MTLLFPAAVFETLAEQILFLSRLYTFNIELDSCPHTVLFPVVYVAVGISGSKEGDNCRPAILNLLEESTQFQWFIY